mmetsp:Transcript_24681/g.51002  ORF Transcript_24681/g.51002 Transcript_24681/m.51002 type:complete len:311 (+) Transcript_24681:212-1144(+)
MKQRSRPNGPSTNRFLSSRQKERLPSILPTVLVCFLCSVVSFYAGICFSASIGWASCRQQNEHAAPSAANANAAANPNAAADSASVEKLKQAVRNLEQELENCTENTSTENTSNDGNNNNNNNDHHDDPGVVGTIGRHHHSGSTRSRTKKDGTTRFRATTKGKQSQPESVCLRREPLVHRVYCESVLDVRAIAHDRDVHVRRPVTRQVFAPRPVGGQAQPSPSRARWWCVWIRQPPRRHQQRRRSRRRQTAARGAQDTTSQSPGTTTPKQSHAFDAIRNHYFEQTAAAAAAATTKSAATEYLVDRDRQAK